MDAPGGPSNPQGLLNAKAGQPVGAGLIKRELDSNIYRADPSGRVDLVINQQDLGGAGNGIAFSPDYKKVYIVARGGVVVADVTAQNKPVNLKMFSDFMIDGIRCGPDGIRVDVYGNLWSGSNAGNNIGYSGVTVWTRDAHAWVPLEDAELSVLVDGTEVATVLTDANGVAPIVYTSTEDGDHVMKVAYAGDWAHKRAQRAQGFTVGSENGT